ncbi:Mitochondrial distribution and morphology protein-like protein [Hapsidospora chrysogenum ATCC 11550]|uniref:Mitochondrial distribution and morphology protein 34 n=1 Tax=Hapsidospora chrysogenum (strain ATCC 11550 / CBS 779.69 / DSM 880 / IAM 14645 / JCM 23072 / IMI 49137) TaxID=857340 RepID=A0A086TI98_HAPC1|nr:Mitochondrial distribution and morphology protein-like protein [Hapsidospora chrysogenum ATCC 11550]
MAFNFNWSPLTADAEFYAKARDLLTKALNKSPKPPIIVDDILVSEFNLGTVPPDLEILEIGDLAEDRFRGIFKMCYSGDAYLTLKTRVQANPLNTYLDSKPSFTSPKPLAAASGLTIPLSITLSEIKLSAFIILVFSKQKGLTLVFRNDPLESLKVSSTFDSIQFVRDYLQRTIEQQLRNLMMEELPAIIHRLSLELWCPDQANKGIEKPEEKEDETGIDPFQSPPEDPVDSQGNLLDPNALSEITLNGGGEMRSLFSQKNLLRLAALTDSHRTLSLFTPGIRDVVYRAWSNRGDGTDPTSPPIAAPSLARTQSVVEGNTTTYTFSDSGSTYQGNLSSRPSSICLSSAGSGLALGAGARARPGRKRKMRVVNLRRSKAQADNSGAADDVASESVSVDVPLSEPLATASTAEEPAEVAMSDIVIAGGMHYAGPDEQSTVPLRHLSELKLDPEDPTKVVSVSKDSKTPESYSRDATIRASRRPVPMYEKGSPSSDTSSVILEQAWVMRMAGEIARRVYDEKKRQGAPSAGASMWGEQEDAPPAYEAATTQ